MFDVYETILGIMHFHEQSLVRLLHSMSKSEVGGVGGLDLLSGGFKVKSTAGSSTLKEMSCVEVLGVPL